jgi:hypothetical protein
MTPQATSVGRIAQRALVALAALGLLAGCGGNEEQEGCVERAEPTPKPKFDRRPRIEGRWRVVYAPLGGEHRQQHTTWAITPSCTAGPCNFRIHTDRGARRLFVYDPTYKTWTGREGQPGYCLIQSAYRSRSEITLTPLRAVRDAARTFATQMFGRITLAPGAQDAGGEASASRQETVRAVRTDPPPGKQVPISSVRYRENRP